MSEKTIHGPHLKSLMMKIPLRDNMEFAKLHTSCMFYETCKDYDLEPEIKFDKNICENELSLSIYARGSSEVIDKVHDLWSTHEIKVEWEFVEVAEKDEG